MSVKEFMVGKTIKSVEQRKEEDYDDVPYLDIVFTDGTKVTVTSWYGDWTGQSTDEYPRFLGLEITEGVEQSWSKNPIIVEISRDKKGDENDNNK